MTGNTFLLHETDAVQAYQLQDYYRSLGLKTSFRVDPFSDRAMLVTRNKTYMNWARQSQKESVPYYYADFRQPQFAGYAICAYCHTPYPESKISVDHYSGTAFYTGQQCSCPQCGGVEVYIPLLD